MKINEQDFKQLPHKREYIALLKKLSHLKKGENPHPYFEKLMILMSQSMAADVVPVLYPYLLELTVNGRDFAFLNFFVNVKIGFYHRGDLNQLSTLQIRQYMSGMFRIRQTMPLVAPKEGVDWPSSFKSMYLWNAMLFYSHSPDVLIFSRNGRFDAPFKVKCCHCGNDIHSLCIDMENMEHTSNITPAPLPKKKEEILFFDDVYAVFWQVFENFGEEYFSKLLPYVYGEYECTVCNQSSVVMEAMKKAQFQKDPHFIPTKEMISSLEDVVLRETPENYIEKWMITCYVVSLWRQLEGLDSLCAMILPVKASRMFYHLLGVEGKEWLYEDCFNLLQKVHENGLTEENRRAFEDLSYDLVLSLYDYAEETGKSKEAEIQWIFTHLLASLEITGEEEKILRGKVAQGYILSRKGGGISVLLDLYEHQDWEKYPEQGERLCAYLEEGFEEQANYEKAIDFLKEKYRLRSLGSGESVEDSSDYHKELGVLYLKLAQESGNHSFFQNAKDELQIAFDFEVKDLGKEYLLPPLLRNLAHGGKKITKKAKEEGELGNRGRATSEILFDMGEICFLMESYDEAVKLYEKSRELWEWVTDVPFVALGNRHLRLAMTYEKLGNVKLAKASCESAITIYKIREKQSSMVFERDEASGRLKDAIEILARL